MVSLIGVINRLSLKDKGSHRLAEGLTYGREKRHRLDVYAPVSGGQNLPVVIFFYGGGWTTGERGSYEFVGRALASLGYIVAVPDYRLVPEVEYPAFLQDCAQAARFVHENAARWGGNPGRIALSGHSAGAYNAAMLALDLTLRETSGLESALQGVACLAGPFDFFPFDGPISLRVFGGVRDPRQTQPIAHVAPRPPPFFLASGNRDPIVHPRNSVAMAAKLRAAGGSVVEKHYDWLEHAGPMLVLGRPARKLAPVLNDLSQFLRTCFETKQGNGGS